MRIFFITTSLAIIILISTASGQITTNPATDTDFDKFRRKGFSVGVAASYAYFYSDATYYDKINNQRIYISPEGQLGLKRTQFIPAIYGFWHPAERHWIGFSTFTINREGNSVQIDRDLGDYKVKGSIYMSDRSSFYYLTYNYLFFHDDRAFILAALGLYGIHLKAGIEARGEIKVDDEPIEIGYHKESVDRFAPFPLIGVHAQFAVSARWYIGAGAAIVGGVYEHMAAFAYESKISARFVITKNFSVLGELFFFNADIHVDEEKEKTKVRYSITALFLGVDIGY
jgi:hypothetical protein